MGEVAAGTVCAVTGLTRTKSGEGWGDEEASETPVLEPVLSYRLQFPDGTDPRLMLPKLRMLEEEEPELHIDWNEPLQEIHARLMGEVQMEVLQSIVRERFGAEVAFDAGQVLYKETIRSVVEGVGHFEPLRHYAEVHLLLEPGDPGSGLQFGTACSEDLLAKNWQRLVLTHLEEKHHVGVLTGSDITDMRITLVSGKAHNKHTEGGDFRQATYRAVRQGLMEAESVLLEPWYAFTLVLPEKVGGRAMHDVEGMHGTCEIAGTDGEMVTLSGTAPVVTMKNYQQTVTAYTRGLGRLSLRAGGFAPCHNAEEVMAASGYDPDLDMANPTGSVFCTHGAGYSVDWCDVKEHMHLEAFLRPSRPEGDTGTTAPCAGSQARQLSLEEIHNILESAHYGNRGKRSAWKRRGVKEERRFETSAYVSRKKETDEEYLLVDGYNIIHAWPELKTLAEANLDSARSHLLDILSNYQGIRKCHIIAVFDAYNVPGRREEITAFHNIHVVFTREAQTADQYIERFAHVNKDKYHITVATSDGLQQMIVRSAGSALLSARELKVVIDEANEQLKQTVASRQDLTRTRLRDTLSSEEKARMNDAAGDTSEGTHE
jgi:predicted RNA-binding protein with PIN domain